MAAEPGFSNDRRLKLARQITAVENDTAAGRKALDETFTESRQCNSDRRYRSPWNRKILPGQPVNQLSPQARKNLTVGIVAVDPSSPFTGGAILGDRVRMRDLAGDNGVFIRSMASRGALGGLALATAGVVQLLDAAGYDVVMIETVGAGQSEVEIARLAHTTLVVEAPGFGDDIQAIKAGIMEIADILVLNKADLPGVESTERALKANLELGYPMGINGKAGHHDPIDKQDEIAGWQPPVIKTVATKGTGMNDLVEAIFKHQEYYKRIRNPGSQEQRAIES